MFTRWFRRGRLLLGLAAATVVASFALPGCVPGGGILNGTLAGTVTNDTTGAGVIGADVSIDPPVDGVSVTTGAGGGYSQSLPAGVYTVTFTDDRYQSQSRIIAVGGGTTTRVDAALTPVQAVFVGASVSGNASPGGTLTASVDVEVLDGSTTVQGYSWSQSNSVEVSITNGDTAVATVTLPGATAFKDELLRVISEPPITAEQLPPNVPLPEGEFPAGLQNRFYVVGINPFSLEEAGLIDLTVTVTTSSGTFTQDLPIHAELPWKVTTSVQNVPTGIPVLLHGKTQDTYNWGMTRPSGAGTTLSDATTQNPYFIPDVPGTYTVNVTDQTVEPAAAVSLTVVAGTWQGAITGQDDNGRPLAANCTSCHGNPGFPDAPDIFTPWKETGHAEIFSANLNTRDHYGESCFACHTVGYDTGVANNGMDDQADYSAFLDSTLLHDIGPDEWTTMLTDYPDAAQLANIQCENCHGPNNSALHLNQNLDAERISLSADVCASCHGEPLRHARFQQWQLSGHANFELAIDESQSGSCARCHTVNGFLAWLPVLLDDDPNTDPTANVEVTWTADEAFPQTCVTCHDPHQIGTTTGIETNATIRISGNTPPLIAGFQVFGAGRGAICMTCHNSRRGLHNDDTFDDIAGTSDVERAPHGSAQTDVLMGQNAFFVGVGVRGSHSLVEDTCVNCHMEQTPPPDLLAYNLGGTNHTFFASTTICSKCHGEAFDATGVQDAFQANLDELEDAFGEAIQNLMAAQIAAGNSIDLGGEATITSTATVEAIALGESHGQQAITVSLTDGSAVGPIAVGDVRVLDGGGDVGGLYDFADERLIKSGWNWNLVNNDASRGVHNPRFVLEVLGNSIDQLLTLGGE
jgi:hypothetical protein